MKERVSESFSHKTTNADATGLCGSLFGKQEPPRAAELSSPFSSGLCVLLRVLVCQQESCPIPGNGQGILSVRHTYPLSSQKKRTGHIIRMERASCSSVSRSVRRAIQNYKFGSLTAGSCSERGQLLVTMVLPVQRWWWSIIQTLVIRPGWVGEDVNIFRLLQCHHSQLCYSFRRGKTGTRTLWISADVLQERASCELVKFCSRSSS